MHALILAAGEGRRLAPATDRLPKCLIDVGGLPLLAHSLDTLIAAKVGDITIVVGHLSDQVLEFVQSRYTSTAASIGFVVNQRYAAGGSLSSFLTGLERVTADDLLVLESDILYHRQYVDTLLATTGNAMLVCDPTGSGDEVYALTEEDGAICRLSKGRELAADTRCIGEMAGMTRLRGTTARKFLSRHQPAAGSCAASGDYEISLIQFSNTEGGMDSVRGVSMGRLPWTEVDTPDDLYRARNQVYPQLRQGRERAD